MEQVQEVTQKAYAVENGNLGTIRLFVESCSVLGHNWVDYISGDKQIVVNPVRRSGYLRHSSVNVVLCYSRASCKTIFGKTA